MYRLETKVRYSQIGPDGRMRLPALVNCLQDCCAAQMEELGIGLSWLGNRGKGWYISSWEIKIHKLPCMHEDIVIRTWPYKFRGMFGYRNFTIETPDGSRLVEVNSLWILMDLKEDKPTRVTDEMLEKYELKPKLEGSWGSRKIALWEDHKEVRRGVVDPGRIDTNGHMNNSQYIALASSVLPQGESISTIKVEYKKPAKLGDEIVIKLAESENKYQVILCDAQDTVFAIVEFGREMQ